MTTDDIFGRKTFETTSLTQLLTSGKLPKLSPGIKNLSVKSQSALVQAVIESPTAARSIAAVIAAGAQVPVVESRKSSKINVTGSTGLSADPWPLSGNGVLPAATATITARQLLSDNGQTDRSILLSKLATEKAFLDVEVAVDQTLKALIEANDLKLSSERTIEIIDYYLNLYTFRDKPFLE